MSDTKKSFVIDKPHTDVSFKVRHMGISNTKGRFDEFRANIEFDTCTLSLLEANIDINSINTSNKTRDNHLRTADFFDADKFPNMKFKMTEFIPKNDDEGVVKGELTIKDKTLPVELEYEFGGYNKLEDGTEKIGFSLEGKINRLDFGVGSKNPMVGNEILISIEVEANSQ